MIEANRGAIAPVPPSRRATNHLITIEQQLQQNDFDSYRVFQRKV